MQRFCFLCLNEDIQARQIARPVLLAAAMILLAITMPACHDETPSASTADRLDVFVSLPPERTFVKRIGGDLVNVHVLVHPGQTPHSYEPTTQQITELARANVFFRIGTTFEDALLRRIKGVSPTLRVVDLRDGITLIPMDPGVEAIEEHEHHDDAHGMDPHVWLDPRRVERMAGTICTTLCSLAPQQAPTFRANCKAFQEALVVTDAQIRKALAPWRGQSFVVFHPAFGYFADAYGLHQIAVEIGGHEPGTRYLTDLVQKAREADVKLIFVQPQYLGSGAAALAKEIGATVVQVDPLAEDYLENLERIATQIQQAVPAATQPATMAGV